jgi:hypothetical protein
LLLLQHSSPLLAAQAHQQLLRIKHLPNNLIPFRSTPERDGSFLIHRDQFTFKKNPTRYNKPTMIRLLLAIPIGAIAILASSCGCCTSDSSAPLLRPLPQFQEIQTAPVEVEYSK